MSALYRVRRTGVGLAVVGLHALGVLTWWTVGHDMHLDHRMAVAPPITIWLPTLAAPLIEPAKQRPKPSATGPAPAAAAAAAVAAAPSFGVAAAMPSAERAAGAETQTAPAPPLNLTLSRQALAPLVAPSFADRSPFHGRLPATVERQIAAAAAETGPWTEERVDNDHFRLRRGSTCIMMERPQAAILDPFSDASRRMPWRASVSRC